MKEKRLSDEEVQGLSVEAMKKKLRAQIDTYHLDGTSDTTLVDADGFLSVGISDVPEENALQTLYQTPTEPSGAEVLIIDRLTDILRSLGKKVKVSRFLKCDGGARIKFYHFLTSTGRRMIVCTDTGFLRSILVQVDPKRRFTWLINGQPGTNMRCLFMDFYCDQRIPFNFAERGGPTRT